MTLRLFKSFVGMSSVSFFLSSTHKIINLEEVQRHNRKKFNFGMVFVVG